MPAKKRPAEDEEDSSEFEIDVDQVLKTKAQLDKVLPPVSYLCHQHRPDFDASDPQGP